MTDASTYHPKVGDIVCYLYEPPGRRGRRWRIYEMAGRRVNLMPLYGKRDENGEPFTSLGCDVNNITPSEEYRFRLALKGLS